MPVDWKPQDKCYFCVDGKLLTVNEVGELVTEQGPANAEAELTNRVSAVLPRKVNEKYKNYCFYLEYRIR